MTGPFQNALAPRRDRGRGRDPGAEGHAGRRLPQARAPGRRLRDRRRRGRRSRPRAATVTRAGIALTGVGGSTINATEASRVAGRAAADGRGASSEAADLAAEAARPRTRPPGQRRVQAAHRAHVRGRASSAGRIGEPRKGQPDMTSLFDEDRGDEAAESTCRSAGSRSRVNGQSDGRPRSSRGCCSPTCCARARAHRHPHRLRHDQLRRLHRARRRPPGQELHDARRPGRRPRGRPPSRAWPDRSELHPLQEGFKQEHGLQCGFCTPGMMMAAKALLDREPGPDRGGGALGAVGQPLPLHRLPEHRQGGALGGRQAAGRRASESDDSEQCRRR